MKNVLENEKVRLTFAKKGAEMTSLLGKENQIEYLWQGNPEFWGRQAPILFPFVGRLKEDQYTFNGETFTMGQHGFARDQDFELIQANQKKLVFELLSTEITKENYPFDFVLQVSYELLEDGVEVSYHVFNNGDKTMYFSIGGHPAFNVPLHPDLAFEDYYLHFSPLKSRVKLPLSGPYIDYENRTLGQTNTDIQLKRELFEHDALVYETKHANSYTIRTENQKASVTLSYEKMPYVGVWSPYAKEAPFVCIEPWYGIADTVDASGQLEEKLGIQTLSPGEDFTCSYKIQITQ